MLFFTPRLRTRERERARGRETNDSQHSNNDIAQAVYRARFALTAFSRSFETSLAYLNGPLLCQELRTQFNQSIRKIHAQCASVSHQRSNISIPDTKHVCYENSEYMLWRCARAYEVLPPGAEHLSRSVGRSIIRPETQKQQQQQQRNPQNRYANEWRSTKCHKLHIEHAFALLRIERHHRQELARTNERTDERTTHIQNRSISQRPTSKCGVFTEAADCSM